MLHTFDVVVVGGGLVGASTAFHLAARSELTVALVERGKICSGGTASSCAIVRTHYSVPGNVALTVESLSIFDDFPAYLGDPEAESGFVRSGYLILAPEGQTSDKLVANMRMQREFAETHAISHAEALELHPPLNLAGMDAVGYEPDSGYADPYLTTTGFERAARRRGVAVMTDQPVERLRIDGIIISFNGTEYDLPLLVKLLGESALDAPQSRGKHFDMLIEASQHRWPPDPGSNPIRGCGLCDHYAHYFKETLPAPLDRLDNYDQDNWQDCYPDLPLPIDALLFNLMDLALARQFRPLQMVPGAIGHLPYDHATCDTASPINRTLRNALSKKHWKAGAAIRAYRRSRLAGALAIGKARFSPIPRKD